MVTFLTCPSLGAKDLKSKYKSLAWTKSQSMLHTANLCVDWVTSGASVNCSFHLWSISVSCRANSSVNSGSSESSSLSSLSVSLSSPVPLSSPVSLSLSASPLIPLVSFSVDSGLFSSSLRSSATNTIPKKSFNIGS